MLLARTHHSDCGRDGRWKMEDERRKILGGFLFLLLSQLLFHSWLCTPISSFSTSHSLTHSLSILLSLPHLYQLLASGGTRILLIGTQSPSTTGEQRKSEHPTTPCTIVLKLTKFALKDCIPTCLTLTILTELPETRNKT